MYLKVHRTPTGGDIVAVCDRELLNTTLDRDGLAIPISEAFYGKDLATEQEVQGAMLAAACINLMGKRAFALARRLNLVEEGGCLLIGEIPHAQIFCI